jgi:hypothetical protein
MSKRTPGPWDIIDQYIIAADESVICQWGSYSDANARLIAAAPDLLAALKALSAGLHDGIDMKANIKAAEVRAARAAIAKAEGAP